MGLTVNQILKATPFNRHKKAAQVAIRGIKVRKNLDNMPMVVAKTQSTQKMKKGAIPGKLLPDTQAHNYVTSIEVYPKGKLICACSCDDWKFTWEVAMVKYGAARVEYSNGEPPTTRNPLKKPGACGHLIALLNHLIGAGKLKADHANT